MVCDVGVFFSHDIIVCERKGGEQEVNAGLLYYLTVIAIVAASITVFLFVILLTGVVE